MKTATEYMKGTNVGVKTIWQQESGEGIKTNTYLRIAWMGICADTELAPQVSGTYSALSSPLDIILITLLVVISCL